MESTKVTYHGCCEVIVLPDGLDGREEVESQKTTDDDKFLPVSKDYREESSGLSISGINRLPSNFHQA